MASSSASASSSYTKPKESIPQGTLGNGPCQGQPHGIVRQVDPEGLRALLAENEKQLQENNVAKSKQEEIQLEYSTLAERLKTLPDNIRYEALVPIGPLVMAPGYLIHTNEITVHLGDNWFVQCSAKSALKICAHRLQKSKESLAKLEKEEELLLNWRTETMKQLTEFTMGGTVEIAEEYNEELEAQWKVKHRENVRKYYQERSKDKSTPKASKEEEEFWARLDELELEEEMEDYEAKKREIAALKKQTEDMQKQNHSDTVAVEDNKIKSKKIEVISNSKPDSVQPQTSSKAQAKPTKSSSFEIIEVKEYKKQPKSQNASILKSQSKESLESLESKSSQPQPAFRKVTFNASQNSTKEYEISESSETDEDDVVDDDGIEFTDQEQKSKVEPSFVSESIYIKPVTERSVGKPEARDVQDPPKRVSLYKQKFWRNTDTE